MQVKISIIIPAFNVGQYIEKTIESTLNQTYGNYEVIVVNDGSKDETGNIIDRYAAENPKLQAIHQENGGVMSARLKGVEHSKGDWVMFLDGDDRLPNDSLAILCSHLSDSVDIVLGKIDYINQEGEIIGGEFLGVEGLLNQKKYARIISKRPKALHGTLYRKSMLKGVTVDRSIVNNEDQIFNIFLTSRVRSVYITDKVVHLYLVRGGSVSKKKYNADYWYGMIAYVRDHYKQYQVEDVIYRRYILSRICSIARNNHYSHLDFDNPVFDHLRDLEFSTKYGLYGNMALVVIKHHSNVILSLIQYHPKAFLKK